jgi:hypothetical protein
MLLILPMVVIPFIEFKLSAISLKNISVICSVQESRRFKMLLNSQQNIIRKHCTVSPTVEYEFVDNEC